MTAPHSPDSYGNSGRSIPDNNKIELPDKEFEKYHKELRLIEKKIAGEIDAGSNGLIIGIAIMAAMFFLILPHAGHCRGIDIVLHNSAAHRETIGFASYIYTYFVLIFNVCISTIALLSRRWILGWISAAGCFLSFVFGVLSIWLRHTKSIHDLTPSAPGIGLYLGLITSFVLVYQWVRLIWSRTNYLLALEQQIRQLAKEKADKKSDILYEK